jgi:hypothetical protein
VLTEAGSHLDSSWFERRAARPRLEPSGNPLMAAESSSSPLRPLANKIWAAAPSGSGDDGRLHGRRGGFGALVAPADV